MLLPGVGQSIWISAIFALALIGVTALARRA